MPLLSVVFVTIALYDTSHKKRGRKQKAFNLLGLSAICPKLDSKGVTTAKRRA